MPRFTRATYSTRVRNPTTATSDPATLARRRVRGPVRREASARAASPATTKPSAELAFTATDPGNAGAQERQVEPPSDEDGDPEERGGLGGGARQHLEVPRESPGVDGHGGRGHVDPLSRPAQANGASGAAEWTGMGRVLP